MTIQYDSFEGHPGEDVLTQIFDLGLRVFGQFNEQDILQEFRSQRDMIVLTARDSGDHLVGFKMGYARSERLFYSWLGGVHPDFRRQGIARELQKQFEGICRKKKYQRIETRSENRFREMMIFNLQNGFEIIGIVQKKDASRIIFEKRLE